MKIIITIFAFITIAVAASVPDDSGAQIIRYENKNDGSGNYKFSYKTSNGLIREETGRLINTGQPDEHTAVQGRYSYIDTNGEKVEIKYIADENGYRIINEPGVPTTVNGSDGVRTDGLPPGVLASLLG